VHRPMDKGEVTPALAGKDRTRQGWRCDLVAGEHRDGPGVSGGRIWCRGHPAIVTRAESKGVAATRRHRVDVSSTRRGAKRSTSLRRRRRSAGVRVTLQLNGLAVETKTANTAKQSANISQRRSVG
jgi:hypothetical protein